MAYRSTSYWFDSLGSEPTLRPPLPGDLDVDVADVGGEPFLRQRHLVAGQPRAVGAPQHGQVLRQFREFGGIRDGRVIGVGLDAVEAGANPNAPGQGLAQRGHDRFGLRDLSDVADDQLAKELQQER